MPATAEALIDSMITALEKDKELLEESLRALYTLKANARLLPPELVKSMAQLLAGNKLKPNRITEVGGENDHKTHFGRIAEFFANNNNKLSSTKDIRDGTGLDRSAVATVLYRTHPDEFVKQTAEGYERLTLWRLARS